MRRTGLIYLLHCEHRNRAATHYVGFTTNPADLAAPGRSGRVVWRVAGTWPGTPARTHAVRTQPQLGRCCPICHTTPQTPNTRIRRGGGR